MEIEIERGESRVEGETGVSSLSFKIDGTNAQTMLLPAGSLASTWLLPFWSLLDWPPLDSAPTCCCETGTPPPWHWGSPQHRHRKARGGAWREGEGKGD